MTNQPKLGSWRNDREQAGTHEDYDYIHLLPKLKLGNQTDIVDLRQYCSTVEDQGYLASCVGNAVVGALELLLKRDGHPYKELSRLFVYYNSRLMHNEQFLDEGTYIRLAMGTLSSLGTCTEKKWPYDISRVFDRPSWGSYRDGHVHKIKSYYRIFASGNELIEQIKTSLRSKHPVVFGMQVDYDYLNVNSTGVIHLPQGELVSMGGHAQLIVGYDDNKRVFIVRNSWGESWGHKGYAYLPYEYLDLAWANDFWVATSVSE